MIGKIIYKMRKGVELKKSVNLPWAKMNTRDILDSKTGDLLQKVYYEYEENSTSPFPAGAEFEDRNGFFIKKRLYLLLISLNFYLITNFKCFGGFKWPLNVRRKR